MFLEKSLRNEFFKIYDIRLSMRIIAIKKAEKITWDTEMVFVCVGESFM